MSLVLVAVVVGVLIAMVLFAALADEPDEAPSVDATSPVSGFLDATRRGDTDLEPWRRRLLALGTSTARELASRLASGDEVEDPAARAAAVSLVEDLGLGGLRELAHALESVDRGHRAVPALVRASACCGVGAWDAVSRCAPDVRCLVAVEVAHDIASRVAPDAEWALPVAATLVAEELPVPGPLLPVAEALPGHTGAPRSPVPEAGSHPGDGPEPTDVGGVEWAWWASRHDADPRVRETLRRVAVTTAPGADHALALLGRANPDEVALLLRARRGDTWAVVAPSWLRVALAGGGDEAERVVVEMLALLPAATDAGDALAGAQPARALGWWVDAFARATPSGRIYIDAALRANRPAVADGLVAMVANDDARSPAAAELVGRLRLAEGAAALAGFGRVGGRAAADAIWGLEMIGRPLPADLVSENPYLAPTGAFLAALGPRPGLSRSAPGRAVAPSG